MVKPFILSLGLCVTTFLFSGQPIKAIIFDCDGTLIDSEEAHLAGWKHAMQNRGHDLTWEQCLLYTGKSASVIAKLIAETIGTDCADEILSEKRAYYRELHAQGLPPIQATVDFVKRLAAEKERLGLKLGVASAAKRPEILGNLRHLGIEELFDVILSGQDDLKDYTDPEGVNKPKPYIYLHAAKLLNVSPAECVVIEDSVTGVVSAKTAGCTTIAIPNRFTESQDLSAADLKMEILSEMSADQFLHTVTALGKIEAGVLEHQGFKLRYQIEGTGPTALVIGGSIYYPRIFSKNLRKHLRLVFTDMRAFAPPTDSLDMPSLDQLLEDIEYTRQTLGLGQIIVIGHSGNAFLALEYAKKYPQNVSHIVMISMGPDLSARSKETADQYWEELAPSDRKTALHKSLEKFPDSQLESIPFNQRFVWNYTRHTPRIWYDFNFDSAPLFKDVHVNMPIFESVWGTLFRAIDIAKGLETLDKPVFLGLGRYDFIVAPPSAWDPLRPKFQDLSMHIFERSGHSPPYEEAELFDAKLLSWLSQH